MKESCPWLSKFLCELATLVAKIFRNFHRNIWFIGKMIHLDRNRVVLYYYLLLRNCPARMFEKPNLNQWHCGWHCFEMFLHLKRHCDEGRQSVRDRCSMAGMDGIRWRQNRDGRLHYWNCWSRSCKAWSWALDARSIVGESWNLKSYYLIFGFSHRIRENSRVNMFK